MAGGIRCGRRAAVGGSGGGSGKRAPLGFCAKISLAVLLGLSFIFLWSTFSSPTSSFSSQRNTFSDISDHSPSLFLPPLSPATDSAVVVKKEKSKTKSGSLSNAKEHSAKQSEKEEGGEQQQQSGDADEVNEVEIYSEEEHKSSEGPKPEMAVGSEADDESSEGVEDGDADEDLEDGVYVSTEDEGTDKIRSKNMRKSETKLGLLFDQRVMYRWRSCGWSGWQNYVPCVDTENLGSSEKVRSHRHRNRSCPRVPVTCLVPLPQEYRSPPPWPEREFKVLYTNVGHPKLSAFLKTKSWLNFTGEYMFFSREKSEFKEGTSQYLDLIEEMVPDIEWGKNVRIVLDIGCIDASFGAILQNKNALVLSLGPMNDEKDLAQLALERGYPAFIGDLGTRRLPFPSGVFDAVHCSQCSISWHSNGGKLLLEMNRLLRPGGYFIVSSEHGDIDKEQGISAFAASICWNIMADKTDEDSEVEIKIYQRPASNGIYEIRRKKEPPHCKQDENQDVAWYTPIKACLHKVASAIEERGTDWPEEWPKRLETFPDWLGDSRGKLEADYKHWKSIVNKSYLNGLGIDWTGIQNVMDMKAIYGGFAAALASQKIWVMNVVPIHAPNTLPIIFERGLLGIYHDWCEPFSTYPRTYDLLHVDHLFSRQKNRCKQPIGVVVEMDRILRPGGWAVIHDKMDILNPLEIILRSLHWEIRMTYSQGKEGLICAQKTSWRP